MSKMNRILTLLVSCISLCSFAQDHLGAFQSVEQMPSWATCEEGDDLEIRTCTVDQIQMHLIFNMDLSTPEMESIQGQTLLIRFVVDSKGNVVKPEIIGGKGRPGETALLNAVNKLPAMNPGFHQGKPVDVLYVIPFRVNS